MALFLASSHPSLFLRNPNLIFSSNRPSNPNPNLYTNPKFLTFRLKSSLTPEEIEPDKPIPTPINNGDKPPSIKITDEWGEKLEPEEEETPSISDSVRDDDEWGGVSEEEGKVYDDDDKLGDLKRCLVDTFYGTELGFGASSEVRAEVLELVNQLEALNPTPAPVEATELLDGNWVLLYTAFSELLPLLAAGTIPLVKVKEISQAIDTTSLTIDNSIIISSPFASFSFSAAATFEVRSPSRIQVQFKEGILKPPEISSNLALPQNIDIFGQKIDLLPVQRTLIDPLQENVANIARMLSGQAPLKVPIPGDSNNSSWLLITYLDKDLRISRGDGGLFILAKEGSSLLN
ncbi:hypothetical protein GIB67_042498 [Kingdonia uniflora]|uniref:Plastid lipid-associated protein/fibrillin conserved domain-containing protein n=1 Tax=Kingdonia uniflora TaxID=39325 RepID=A0A7J7M0Y4_9MAGN|nr:hypothetical protein GIB67_042498 [Kingdonia uniflora]